MTSAFGVGLGTPDALVLEMLIVKCAKWRTEKLHSRKSQKEEAPFEAPHQKTGDSGQILDMGLSSSVPFVHLIYFKYLRSIYLEYYKIVLSITNV